MNAPLVSVILCNYNYSKYIDEAIKSVINQSYTNFELIIVDDGSTDNSKEIILSYSDPRIISLFQENKGQAAAFNSGFKYAKGDFIAFLDSDDKWYKNKLLEVINIFKKNSFSIVQHYLHLMDSNSKTNGEIHAEIPIYGEKNILQEYFISNHTGFFSTTSGIVCKKEHLDIIFPIDEKWKICADVLITRPLPLLGNVYTLKEILGCYRIHGDNCWMNTAAQKELKNHFKYTDYVNNWLEKYGYTSRINFIKSSTYFNEKYKHYTKFLLVRIGIVLMFYIIKKTRYLLYKSGKYDGKKNE